MAERVHGRQGASRDGQRCARVVDLMQHRERALAVNIHRSLLGLAKSARDIALLERPASAGSEHEVAVVGVASVAVVALEDCRQLTRNRHRARRAICLRGAADTVSVDLEAELDLGVFGIG